jgi:hypothetical protein
MLSKSSASAATTTATATSRRALLLASAVAVLAQPRLRSAHAAAGAVTPPEDNSSSKLVQELLAKSNAPGMREKRAKERLEAYNDKIYGEGYFEVEVGQGAARARGISDETATRIRAWQAAREQRLNGGGRK